jgi:predicted DCC family thiol-disulfide oxidoreductase YuxK
MESRWIVGYDGYCNLCSWAVRWIRRNEGKQQFSLVPLQQMQSDSPETSGAPETVLLWINGKAYDRSTAVLRIALKLRFPWPLLGIFLLVPRFLRDPVYDLVARNRKRWFGARSTCYLP